MENRLKTSLDRPGGVTFDTAMAAAERNLADHREVALAELDSAIALIQGLVRGGAPDAKGLRGVNEVAAEITGVAGAYGLTELAAAAGGLAKLTAGGAAPEARVLAVHAEALPLLRSTDPAGAAHRRTIIEGLGRVLARQIGD